MFRERPLTWLLLAATVTVNGLLLTIQDSVEWRGLLKLGLLLGQLAVLAIWSVRGAPHRLARGAALVLGTAGLTCLLVRQQQAVWLAANTLYVAGLALVVVASEIVRTLRAGAAAQAHWRAPLIEFFGWTIVVAVASWGVQAMDFSFFSQLDFSIILAMISVPAVMAIAGWRDRDALRWAGVLVCVLLVTGAAALFLAFHYPGGWIVSLTQAGYLALWGGALAMDRASANNRARRQRLNSPGA